MKPPPFKLLELLREARALVARPGNDFSRSSWPDASAALAEIDALTDAASKRAHGARTSVSTLFAPTGALQAVGLASGWGEAYQALGARCDHAIAELSPD